MPESPVLVAGAGAWGTALACVLADGGRPVLLWGHQPAHLREIEARRENVRHLPGLVLPASITTLEDLKLLPAGCRMAVLATPCQSTRETTSRLRAECPGLESFVCSAKGLEVGSQSLVHEVVREAWGRPCRVAILSGPTFAREVAEGKPAAITLAADDPAEGERLRDRFHTARFRAYLSDDLTGVALGGSVKNVLAIASGMADGMLLGANSRAALITRGLAEMARLGVARGARRETFMGLSGLGDLVLTATDDQSRNRRFGVALGRGGSLAAASAVGLVEGASTALAVEALARSIGIDMPIVSEVARIVRGESTPQQAVGNLMNREPTLEFEP